MSQAAKTLSKIASELDGVGLTKQADTVDEAIKNIVIVKKAQYESGLSYWVHNQRCFGKCYRQKRASKPSLGAQEVWMDCWKEYQEGLKNPTDWAKYADADAPLNTTDHKNFGLKWASDISKEVSTGTNLAVAITDSLQNKVNDPIAKLSSTFNALMTLAEELSESGKSDLSKKVANSASELIKEAQSDWAGVRQNLGKGNLGQAWNSFNDPSGYKAYGKSNEAVQQALKQLNTSIYQALSKVPVYKRTGDQYAKTRQEVFDMAHRQASLLISRTKDPSAKNELTSKLTPQFIGKTIDSISKQKTPPGAENPVPTSAPTPAAPAPAALAAPTTPAAPAATPPASVADAAKDAGIPAGAKPLAPAAPTAATPPPVPASTTPPATPAAGTPAASAPVTPIPPASTAPTAPSTPTAPESKPEAMSPKQTQIQDIISKNPGIEDAVMKYITEKLVKRPPLPSPKKQKQLADQQYNYMRAKSSSGMIKK